MARRSWNLARGWRSVIAAGTAMLAACSPLTLINGWAPSGSYRATNGIPYGENARHRLDVYDPVETRDPRPVIVFFYGGNWDSGNRSDYLFVGEALASKGYIAVIPDYRLYPEVRFPDFLDDAAKAVRWTLDHIAEYGGDPRRVFLMGHSAGAYNAAMLALDPQYLRAAGVGPGRISGLIGLAGPYDFLPLNDSVSKAVFGFPDTPVNTQPIHFVSAAAPPALLITGASDDTVDPGNTSRLAARLREAGVTVREISYPHRGHALVVGALSAYLRALAPTLKDVESFVNEETADGAQVAARRSVVPPLLPATR